MSRISENNSKDKESSQDTEFHPESGAESETGHYTLSTLDQRNSILHVQFPMPYTFPKPYLMLNEVLDNTSDHKWNQNIAKDPDEALCCIINHCNIDIVSQSIQRSPEYLFEQVYYSTYIDTSQFTRLQYLISLASRNLRYKNAHAQRLALEQQVRYYRSDNLSPYLLQCLL